MAARWYSTSPRTSLYREWLALAVVVLGLVAWLHASGGLRRVDYMVQDMGMRLQARPAHPDIAIIAIDDRSIDAIGRWPWRRALHAQLVQQISEQSPRAIGLDILFGEEDDDYPGDDVLLARALAHSGHAVLPVARRSQSTLSPADVPLAPLRQAAAQIGHVQVQVDSDGVTRSIFREEGPQAAPWPHFSRAMLCAEGLAQPDCRGNAEPAAGPWVQQELQILGFATGRPAFATHSYVDVLKGEIPPDALRDKYVLVGATATGLGDMFAAPVAAQAERIAGVEVIAHALNAELARARIQPAPKAWDMAFNLAPAALALAGMLLLGPLAGLMVCAALFVCLLAAAALAPGITGWQVAAAPGLAGVLLVYPLWSWRRLSAAAHFLQLEIRELQRAGTSPLPEEPSQPVLGDVLERRIHAVEDATRRLHKLHHFISGCLQHLPSPTFVCDAEGRVTLANEAAVRHVQAPIQGRAIAQVLAGLAQPATGIPLLPQDARRMAAVPAQQEGQDAQGRHLLMLCKPFDMGEGSLLGSTVWLITLVDLTDMRRAQQQRDQALNFISHDIRAPIASILTLLEMQRAFPSQMPQADLLARVERYAQSSLAMAQGFVQLAGAQTHSYHSAPFDLAATLEEAVDDTWAKATERGVKVHFTPGPDGAPFQGDRGLISRAIANVLGNAIKFSPPGGAVHCALSAQGSDWLISIRDEGPGIAPELQANLFQPFKRLHEDSHPGVEGMGLGLALVQTVVQRHGGRVEVQSSSGAGAEFRLLLPQGATLLDQ